MTSSLAVLTAVGGLGSAATAKRPLTLMFLAQPASTGAERQKYLTHGWGARSPQCTEYVLTVRRTEADLLRAQYLGFVAPNPMRHSPATTQESFGAYG
jgi:hypothetical protein